MLAWQLQWQGGDVDAVVPVVEAAKAVHPTLASCRFGVFDVQGFHSPANQSNLRDLLSFVTLPVKSRGNAATQTHETSDAFQAARKQHPAFESTQNRLLIHLLINSRKSIEIDVSAAYRRPSMRPNPVQLPLRRRHPSAK